MNDNKKSSFVNILKVITAVIAVIGGVYLIEDRYFTSIAAEKMEQQIVQTIDQLQQKMNQAADVQLLDRLQAQKRGIKRELRENPDDLDLKEEYQEILEAIKRVKGRLEKYRTQ